MQGVQAALAGWRQSSKDKRPLIPSDKKSQSQTGGPFSESSQNGFRFRTADIEGPPSAFFGLNLSDFSNARYFDASDLRSLLRDNATTLVPAAVGICVLVGLLSLFLSFSPGAPAADTSLSLAAASPLASSTWPMQCTAIQFS